MEAVRRGVNGGDRFPFQSCIWQQMAVKNGMTLTAVVYSDAGSDWLVAFNPETGTTTQGKTVEEAVANLKEATELYLEEFPSPVNRHPVLTTFETGLAHA